MESEEGKRQSDRGWNGEQDGKGEEEEKENKTYSRRVQRGQRGVVIKRRWQDEVAVIFYATFLMAHGSLKWLNRRRAKGG